MENLSSPRVIKEIITKYNFNFSKSLGQNFLIDGNVVDKIVDLAQITKDDYVLEIGPGIGTLTQILCQRAKKVIAVEIDNKLIPVLNENLKEFGNLEIIHNDILKVDINKLIDSQFEGKDIKIVANLPYYVTTPIIMGLLEKNIKLKSITVMIQKEVAQRINAKPGSKDYGALSIAVQYYSSPKLGFVVSKNCFMPSPKVDSIVLRLDLLESPATNVASQEMFFKVVRASFGQRRKTLVNALINSGTFSISKEELLQLFGKIGFSKEQRGETLTIEQFALLSDNIY